MANYIRLKKSDLHQILKRYRLDLQQHKDIEAGAGNSNILIRTEEKRFVLTIFEIPYHRAARLARLLGYLRENGYPTSRIYRLPDGKPLTAFQGKPVLLKNYLPGDHRKKPGRQMLRQIGAALAQLHDLEPPAFMPDRHDYEISILPTILEQARDTAFAVRLNSLRKSARIRKDSDLLRGLIHGDLFPDNVLFNNSQLTGVIDFEEACHHVLAFDLGMAIVGLCVEGQQVKLENVRALLSGYQGNRPLPPAERRSIQHFAEYAALLTAAWRYWKYHLDFPDPKKSGRHLEMTAIAGHLRSIPAGDFQSVFNG